MLHRIRVIRFVRVVMLKPIRRIAGVNGGPRQSEFHPGLVVTHQWGPRGAGSLLKGSHQYIINTREWETPPGSGLPAQTEDTFA